MITRDIEYSVGGVRYVGTFVADDAIAGKRPGVLVAPEGGGLVDLTRSIARRLAEAGYAAFAMDYYGDGKALTDMSEVMTRLGPWMADPAGIRAIATAALASAARRNRRPTADRLAAIGYCFRRHHRPGTGSLRRASGGHRRVPFAAWARPGQGRRRDQGQGPGPDRRRRPDHPARTAGRFRSRK